MSHPEAAGEPGGTASELVVAMTGASGAPYAIRLLQVLCRQGRTVHLTLSPSAAQVLREETGLAVGGESLRPRDLRRPRPGSPDLSSPPGFHGGDRQRVVSHRRHGRHPVQHEHSRGDRARSDRPT